MGEYAKHNGRRIKIGTCEDMLYLRADQAHLTTTEPGNIDPVTDAESIRFRFPFPDEDDKAPGEFEDPFRSVGFYDISAPNEVKHHTRQFTAPGYVVSLPCPETAEGLKLKPWRNGNPGPVRISQQKVFNGMLILICECGGCGAKWRCETLEMAQPLIDKCRLYGSQDSRDGYSAWWNTIADRIKAGYTNPPAWVVALCHKEEIAQ